MRHAIWGLMLAGITGCGTDGDAPDLIYKSAPPEDLATSGPPEALEVSWTAPPHALRYNVYYSTDPEQWIRNYAAYDDAGLEMTTETSVVLDLSAITKHVYFQVTGEIDIEGDPAFAVALLGYRTNADVADDHIQGLQWRRCPEGMTFGAGTCSGTPIEMSGPDAVATYGDEPPESGWRPPTYTEWQALMSCGGNDEARFEVAHDAECGELLPEILLGHGNLSYYVYDDANQCMTGRVLAVTPQGGSGCHLAASSKVSIALVRSLGE